jgi:hypothetical protein
MLKSCAVGMHAFLRFLADKIDVVPQLSTSIPKISISNVGDVIYGPRRFSYISSMSLARIKLNSVAVVRKRTIPTERPPIVGVVSAYL